MKAFEGFTYYTDTVLVWVRYYNALFIGWQTSFLTLTVILPVAKCMERICSISWVEVISGRNSILSAVRWIAIALGQGIHGVIVVPHQLNHAVNVIYLNKTVMNYTIAAINMCQYY